MESAEVTHTVFMRRAMELAASGAGNVSPNPMVGCVIVYEGKIIGEGYHKKYGESHAEPNAINSVANHELLKKSTLYVTLEPCSHWGKTPPCADLIIEKKIPKVVVSNLDPNPLVAGSGIEKLKKAGIEVISDVLQKEGNELNKRFFCYYSKKRPYVILKWAQTADGFIARENFDSKWISDQYSRQLVHKWRAEEDAILVGYSTALYDDPELNVRDWTGRNPTRIVIDRDLALPKTHKLFDQSQKTLVINNSKNETDQQIEYIKCDVKDIGAMVNELYLHKIQSIIIEGGPNTMRKFIEAGLWDEARVFKSDKTFIKGIAAPDFSGTLIHKEKIMTDTLEWWVNE